MDKSTQTELHVKWQKVPGSPGVYLMKDTSGKVIYVGKALNLKKRTAAYFSRAEQPDPKTTAMVERIADFETIVTQSEKEALILEANLIKRYRPRYNVLLKDGKRYPSICINVQDPYPFLSIIRKVVNNGAVYFGPYSSASAVGQTIKIIHKTFKLRKCRVKNPKRKRPCIYYQMNACLAPCCYSVPQEQYRRIVDEVILFLNGRTPDLMKELKQEMGLCSQNQEFEQAAVIRDKLFSLQKTLEKQVVVSNDFKDRDVIALAEKDDLTVLTLMIVRGGFLVGTSHYDISETFSNTSEQIETFLRQYYEKDRFIPSEILIPQTIESRQTVETLLKGKKGAAVQIRKPKRGAKVKLIRLARLNAEKEIKERVAARLSRTSLLTRLQKKLELKSIPGRIECFDNSNIQGTAPVAAMVVFTDGVADKSGYRKYSIRTVSGPDDYASMQEVLKRRFADPETRDPLPDLLMVDGGKGQLGIALSVLEELNLDTRFGVIGIAKKNSLRGEKQDKIFLPRRSNAVNFGREEDLLLLLQQVRDEAHRFAITFHRRKRSKGLIRSELDSIPGIGHKRKTALLRHFKSVQNIRAADISEIIALPCMNRKAAALLLQHLNQQ